MSIRGAVVGIAACVVACFALSASAQSGQATVGFNVAAYSFMQTESPMLIEFVRFGGTVTTAVTIDFTIQAGGPYSARHLQTTMPVGETRQLVDIWTPTFAFYAINTPVSLPVHIDSATNAQIVAPSTTTVTITPVPAMPEVSISDATVIEGSDLQQRFAVFTITITNTARFFELLTLHVVAHDGTAHAGSDYTFTPAAFTLFFDKAQVLVPIIGDHLPEGDETFTLEITDNLTGYGVNVAKRIGTGTIIDDDDAVGPSVLKIERGGKAAINVDFTDPAASAETLTLAADPNVVAVPSIVTIPAGASSATIPVTAVNVGATTITVTTPPSRGGRAILIQASVYDPAILSFDRAGLSLELGTTSSIQARLDPPPAVPLDVAVSQTNPAVAMIPSTMTIGTDGQAVLQVHGMAVGRTAVTATLPDTRGGTQAVFGIDVTVPNGVAITSLSKSSGRAAGNERVQLFGNNFSGRCVVTFGGLPSPDAQPAAGGSINASTPPHDPGTVDVAVKCGDGSYTFHDGFTYMPSPLRLTLLAPTSGTTSGGTLVRVSGENVRSAGCEAWFGDAPARTIATSGTTDLVVVAPAHAAGDVTVTMRCGGETSSLAHAFSYFAADDAPATIASFGSASVRRGDRLTILGSRFRRDDAITIAGLPAIDVVSLSADTHVVTVPDVVPGSVTVALRDAAGRTVVGPSLTINGPAAPAITKIADKIPAGAELAIGGSGFRRGLKYSIGSIALPPLAMTSTDATFRVPTSAAAGATQFVISDGTQTLVTRNVEVTTSGLRVAAIAPPCASESGGTLVTISGAGFESGAVVQFGSAYSADAAVIDANTIAARVPPSFGTMQALITIFNRSGASSTLTGAFTYTSPYEGCGGGRTRGSRH